jgi:putative regulator of septum formation
MRWLIRLGILAVMLGGGYLFRDRLSSSPTELAVGDCFDVPAVKTAIKNVQHHPCTESHTGEVFALVTHPAAKGAPPPADAAMLDYLYNVCGPLFISYVGPVAAGVGNLDAGAFYPPDKGWADGDRGITCYAYRVDRAPMTGSVKAAH